MPQEKGLGYLNKTESCINQIFNQVAFTVKRAQNRLEMQYLHLLQGYWYWCFDVGEGGLFVTFLKFEKNNNNKNQEYFCYIVKPS
jgi:hypothetical protein